MATVEDINQSIESKRDASLNSSVHISRQMTKKGSNLQQINARANSSIDMSEFSFQDKQKGSQFKFVRNSAAVSNLDRESESSPTNRAIKIDKMPQTDRYTARVYKNAINTNDTILEMTLE
jgi:hypothetical protein